MAIGLPIGGHMPAEIAVSIAAEIVQEKNRYDVSYIDGAVEDAVRKKENGIMITIISKSGSSPRGTGSKMFIDKDGNSYAEKDQLIELQDSQREDFSAYRAFMEGSLFPADFSFSVRRAVS